MRTAAIVLVVALSAVAQPSRATDISGWDVHTNFTNGAVVGCSAIGTVSHGAQVGISVDRRFQWTLLLSRSDWALPENGTTELSASVDHRLLARGAAVNVSATVLALSIDGAARYAAIENGRELEVKSPAGGFAADLVGAGPALSSLLECVRTINEAPPPSAQAASPPGRQSQIVSFSEASVMLTNLLSTAGVQGYRLVPPPTPDTTGVQFALADGTKGLFQAFRNQSVQAVEDQVGVLIGQVAQTCKGNFRSAKTSVPTDDGSLARKIGTTCSTSGSVIATTTTLVRHPDGFVVQLVEIAPFQSSGLPAAKVGAQQPSALVNAAMQLPDTQHN